jgi:hypothetical protein
MTMLMHTRDPFKRVPYLSGRRDTAGAGGAQTRSAAIKRFVIRALMMVAAAGALAAIMALKVVAYLPRLNYH